MEIKDIFTRARYFDTAARREKLQSPELIQKTKAVRHRAGLRNAYCKTDAGEGSTIVCYLDVDGTGTEITVNCDISNGNDLNTATRRLKNGNRLAVYKIGSSWYAAEGFDTDEECSCV